MVSPLGVLAPVVAELPAHCDEGRRARKKRETRLALARAAVELVLAHGLERVTVEQVSDAADVSPRTFFNYFASKEEAITNPDPDSDAQVVAALLARPPEEEPVTALAAAYLSVTGDIVSSPADWRARIELINRYPTLLVASMGRWHRLERQLAVCLAGRLGLPADAFYPEVLVGAVSGAARAAVHRWGHHADDRPLSEQMSEAIELVRVGFAAPATAPTPTPTPRSRRRPGAPTTPTRS
jgi:AcrR family transcriptional regulator